jgi:hypothetical protein
MHAAYVVIFEDPAGQVFEDASPSTVVAAAWRSWEQTNVSNG